jgi:peptide/nickel transport system permease protein
MTNYIVRRLLQAIPTVFGITLLSFIIMQAAPGDPVQLMTFSPSFTAEDRERLTHEFCLDRSVAEQYLIWLIGDLQGQCRMRGLLRGDFGESLYEREPVLDIILERVPATLELTGLALLIGVTIGMAIGLVSAIKRGSFFDNSSRFFSVLFDAIPQFWFGLILIMIFSVQLGLLPVGGRMPLNDPNPTIVDRLRHLLMPTVVLAVTWVAIMSRYMRAESLEVINQDYVTSARAKGMVPRTVYIRHVARNALVPIVTILGPAITALLSGAVVIERIFSWPGIGRLAVDAVSSRDYPIVMGTVIVGAVLVILGTILADILLATVDPRIRFE